VLGVSGQALVYARETKAEADIAKVLTFDEARQIAVNVAKLADFLGDHETGPLNYAGPNMTLLDLVTLLSYVALNVDILFQIRRIYRTKSSRDLSLFGMGVRYTAIFIILIKFVSLSDLPLIVGQGLIVLTYTTYFALALYYFAKRSPQS